MTISDYGWNLQDMWGASPLPCTVCGRDIAGHEMFYTPSHIDESQEERIRYLYNVDARSDFQVCEECTEHEVFDDWLATRLNHPGRSRLCRRSHNWRKEGF